MSRVTGLIAMAAFFLGNVGYSSAQDSPGWTDVRALFEERCTMCHSGESAPLGLRLDNLENALAGSVNGPVVVPGDPDASELVRRIRGESQPMMPLAGDPLSPAEIALVENWISEGLLAAQEAEAEAEAEAEDGIPKTSAAQTTEDSQPAINGQVTFADVEPILMQRCVVCHSDAAPGGPPEGLQLDSYKNVMAGGERLVILPGRPEHSELVRRIEGTALPRMPLDGPPWLTEEDIQLIREWVAQGATDADGNKAPVPVGSEIRLRGILTGLWSIDDAEFAVNNDTRIDDRPSIGEPAEMRGVIGDDGAVRATRVRSR